MSALLLTAFGLHANHPRASRATATAGPPSALVPITEGSEELEATAIVNVLRRAGWSVTLASVGVADGAPVLCARGQRLLADTTIEEAKLVSFDVVAIPGGMPGAERLGEDASVIACLRKQREAGNWYGAICAAPAVALAPSGLLPPQATCHPAFESTLAEAGVSAADLSMRVVVDDEWRCVTSRGPGTAIDFALKLVEVVEGPEAAAAVGAPMVLPRNAAALL